MKFKSCTFNSEDFMLSILIPIYNFDIRNFVNDIHRSAEKAQTVYEIILIDDASDTHFQELNQEISELSNITFIKLESNIGRSKIRNLLAEKSKYDYLLFTDCDSKIIDPDYVENYVKLCKGELVICGGTIYEKNKPDSSKEYLRWHYGKKRESKRADERKQIPHRSFMTNNYVISKSIHKSVKFDESISEYGHEDTLFGIELKRKGIRIHHIDNPLIHIGLESSEEFIRKTKKGIDTLNYISEHYSYSELYEDIKLLHMYKNTQVLSGLWIFLYNTFENLFETNLKGKNPSLKIFDLYKLAYLHKIRKLK